MTSPILIIKDEKNISKYNNKCEDHYPEEQRYIKLPQLIEEQGPSFLNISRENLNISQVNIDKGFNKQSLLCWKITNRQTILNICTVILAISCIIFEIFKYPKVLENSKNIEMLKRDLQILQREFYHKNFLNEFKDFEQQFYDDSIDDIWSGDDAENNENDEIDNYDNYIDDYNKSESSDNINVKNMNSQNLSTTSSILNHDLEQIFNNTKKSSKSRNNNETKTESEQLSGTLNNKNNSMEINNTERRLFLDFLNIRRKRSAINDQPTMTLNNNNTLLYSPILSHAAQNDNSYKYMTNSTAPTPKIMYKTIVKRRRRQYRKALDESKKSTPRSSIKRNHHVTRQIFAAHYGADSSLYTEEDEHTGNGRFRHNEGIFKAWRPSDWMNDFQMDQYFSLNNDGRLTIHEPGLYLVYAQIHYLDEHDENGFHLLVNARPIFQCMVYSPGTGHKSRSCFSAQVILLQNGDRIVLKDIGVSRYTLFQRDKSFFGLVKIGDLKYSQIHPTQILQTEE